jgi:PAS domain S-box-containing protein
MHKLLAIQLRKHLGVHEGADAAIPDDSPLLKKLQPFLLAVDEAYHQFDRDLSLGHRSLILSNEELQVALERGQRETQERRAVLEGLRRTAQGLFLAPEGEDPSVLESSDPWDLLTFMERLIQERTEARIRMEEREAQYRSVLESLKEVVFQLDRKGRWQYLNGAWTHLTGYTVGESIGHPFLDYVLPEDRVNVLRRFREIAHGRFSSEAIEARCLTRNGDTRWVKVHTRRPTGDMTGISGILTDITEQKRSETALLQAQKLESLGVLAGGIAHDFNNLLVAIMGNADLALQHLDEPERARRHMQQVSSAIERAAELCRQLLAYSGKGRFTVENLDLNALVREMVHLLKVSIGKNVELDYHLADRLPAIEADPSQIRQAVMNLVINASEAIGERSGRVHIETGVGHLGTDTQFRTYLSHQVNEGPSIYLKVRDDGCGMDEETLKRIFDPFFTTKFTGRGLGLAAILGIVRSHKGSLLVDSRVDEGTTFCLQFPAAMGPTARTLPLESAEGALRSQGRVLLVDDEPTVREIVGEALEVMGFTVEEAANGQEGLEAFERRKDEFLAVFLDLTMPVMGGEEAFRRIQRLRPGVPIILMSGYSEQEALSLVSSPGLVGFLQKPFKLRDLSRMLQRVLASAPALQG